MNDEERNLKSWKQTLEAQEIPEIELEKAILQGVEQAKQQQILKKRQRARRPLLIGLTAAVICLLFVTTIRVSPAFADAVSSFPGMKKIVALIQDNEGLTSAIRNEHFQKIGVTGEALGVQITLDGIIPSEENIVLFYTSTSKTNHEEAYVEAIGIKDSKGEEIEYSIGITYGEDEERAKQTTNSITVDFVTPIVEPAFIVEFEVIDAHCKKEVIELPFTFDIEKAPSLTYAVDEKLTIDGQSLTVHQVKINPVVTSVEIEFDEKNTKEILNIGTISIEGKRGRTWASIQNGTTARSTLDHPNHVTYFLQSNYFNQSGDLKLRIGNVMALDKDDRDLIVNTDTKTILKQPTDERFSNVQVEDGEMRIAFKGEKGFQHYPVSSDFEDAHKEFFSVAYWGSTSTEKDGSIMLKLPSADFQNPITFKINGYPNYLEQKKPVVIDIK